MDRAKRMPPDELGERPRVAVEEVIAACPSQELVGAMRARSAVKRYLGKTEGPTQRRPIDALSEEPEFARAFARANTNDFAPEVLLKRAQVGTIISVTGEIESNSERRTASPPHRLDRESEEPRRVDAPAGEHGHALRVAEGAIDRSFERCEERRARGPWRTRQCSARGPPYVGAQLGFNP